MNAETIAAALAAIATALAVIVAASAIFFETRRWQRSTEIELLITLEQRFNGPDMREVRRQAAHTLLFGSGNPASVDELLNFFELVGHFATEKMLNRRHASEVFGHWICPYWDAVEGYVRYSRVAQRSDSLWIKVEDLNRMVTSISDERSVRTDPEPDDSRIQMFLEREAGIFRVGEDGRGESRHGLTREEAK